jgi:DNA-binding CsgD family transcriptional regulator
MNYGQVKKIGTPNIINYRKSIYQAGTQNWSISQDKNGFMYFANNEGVLFFNGIQWQLIKISKAKPVRSIFTDSNNTTYVGVLNDFGFLEADARGLLAFRSLRSLLPEDVEDFDEIWRIFEFPEGIVFQTFEYMFILKDDEIEVIKPKSKFHFAFNLDGRLFVQEPEVGIFEYINGDLLKTRWSDAFLGKIICDMTYVRDDHFLICTTGDGIYQYDRGEFGKWDTPMSALGREYQLYTAKKLFGNYIAFGSILNGILISDLDGNLIQKINKDNGLQNNTVLSIFMSRDANLWIGLDNGIDYVQLYSPITYLTSYGRLGTGYTARIFKDKIYLGTNQGLYVRPYKAFNQAGNGYELVENSTGQVWSLEIFDDQLICGHNNGTYLIEEKEAVKISGEEGGWTYISLQKNPGFLLGGTYDGLVLFRKDPSGWVFDKIVKGFNESCRFLLQSKDGSIWMSHGAKGIFRITLSTDLDSVTAYTLYNSENGLPSDENNIIFNYKEEIYISTINGIYKLDKETNRFKVDKKTNSMLNLQGRLKTLVKDEDNDLWFIAQDESGVLRLNEDNTYTKITLPFKQLDNKYVNEFEFIYPYNNNNVILAIDDGFAHYSASISKSYKEPMHTFITEVKLPYIDSIIGFAHLVDHNSKFVFPFKRNAFRFHFTSPFFEDPSQLKFSYFLDNYSQDWSDWSDLSFRDLTNLPEGDYIFKVKAINIYGVESEPAVFEFSILPPWYRSAIAYYLYVIFALLISFIIARFIHLRVRNSKLREQERHHKELQIKQEQFELKTVVAEKEIVRLRNEKLRVEMVHRNKELANQAMNIIQKNKFLSTLKDALLILKKGTVDDHTKDELRRLTNKIDREIDNKQQDKVFKTYFEEVHKGFFERIKIDYPELSPRELHLCAYIRMNLTTKEIAALLNISERGVEISRYRLRKKLELSRQDNLSVFLSNI